jgi:hypothetical protein
MVDTTLSPPAVLDPPFKDPVVDGAQIMTDLWQAWCTGVSRTPMLLTGGGVIMQTGTSTSDPAGLISVTLPAPFTMRTLDFQCDGSPAEPHAFFNQGTVVALPLDVITGLLEKDSGGGTIVPVPNAPFTWFATGV